MTDSFSTKAQLQSGDKNYTYYSLPALSDQGFDIGRLPYSLRILLENLLRREGDGTVFKADIEALANWNATEEPNKEIAFMPARVILQDFTGVPCVVDLAAMRDAMAALGGDPAKINPLIPAELVIDHSVQVDAYGGDAALLINRDLEYERNAERYSFLKWGQEALGNFKVVPPNTGIVHQVNLEHLARVTFVNDNGVAYPDTLVGTDSHTTMINGLGVLGWGVGGIEAEAAMLGQPVSMLIPQVVGFRLSGRLPEGTTATDLVLTVTEMLRKHGVVGKFVEFYGEGLKYLPLADRATIGNMSPEYGATCAIFPVDDETLRFMRLTGRSEEQIALTEAYYKAQHLFWQDSSRHAEYSSVIDLNLATVEASLAGPKRPQDRIRLADSGTSFRKAFEKELAADMPAADPQTGVGAETGQAEAMETSRTDQERLANAVADEVKHGDVAVAAITSCTNTSNPSVMLAAGLVAKKAYEKGLQIKPWVKTSLSPGSRVAADILQRAGLLEYLEKLHFNIAGFGCMTCIGNSGPLPERISRKVNEKNLVVTSVLSGNRNFEGRINQDVKANYLMSPPLVVAFALAGSVDKNLLADPLGKDKEGKEVFLRDIWPTQKEIAEVAQVSVRRDLFEENYADVFAGDEKWQSVDVETSDRFNWDANSTYVRHPPYFTGIPEKPAEHVADLVGMRPLAKLGDSITTDHISPAGTIKLNSPAGEYLTARGVPFAMFNSYGSRRGNDEVMVRGTFANVRLRNQIAPGTEGGFTTHLPTNTVMPIYDASVKYAENGTPLLILAGKEYGSGSSRDWAAKGTMMLGVRAVLAQSFERIHRANLVMMGVLPIEFVEGQSAETLGLTGHEFYDLVGLSDAVDNGFEGGKILTMQVKDLKGRIEKEFPVKVRIDTPQEVQYYIHGGILPYVLRSLLAS